MSVPFPDLTQLPTGDETEMRTAARAAAGLLLIDDARLYGFITGGPLIDRGRCEDMLALAAEHGITVEIDAATESAISLVAALNGHDTDLEADADV